MSRVCELTGKKVMTGNNVSHAKIEQEDVSFVIYKILHCLVKFLTKQSNLEFLQVR